MLQFSLISKTIPATIILVLNLVFISSCQENKPTLDEAWPTIDSESQKIIEGKSIYQLDPSLTVPSAYLAQYSDSFRVYFSMNGLYLDPNFAQDPAKHPRKTSGSEVPRKDLYEQLKQKTFQAVTNEFGPTVINMRTLKEKVEAVRAKNQQGGFALTEEWRLPDARTQIPERGITEFDPWSSYFYPESNDLLYVDTKRKLTDTELKKSSLSGGWFGSRPSETWVSPLRQLHVYQQDRGRKIEGNPADWEKQYFIENSKSTQHWFGLCDAWSMAALAEPEPTKTITIETKEKNLVSFTPGDQKALLLKKYEYVDMESSFKMYGQKNDGNPDSSNGLSGDHEDLYPEQVHRFIDAVLYGNRWPSHMGTHVPRPFLMDHYANQDIWTVPVYAGRISYRIATQDGVPQNNTVLVRLDLFAADSYHEADKRELLGKHKLNKTYYYALYGNYDETSGELTVHSSLWLNYSEGMEERNSILDHPDYFLYISDVRNIKFLEPSGPEAAEFGLNPYLDLTSIEEILRTAN